MKLHYILTALVWLAALGEARAAGPSVILYQPNNVLTMRLGDDVAPFATYIKGLEAAAEPFLGKDKAELLDVFVVIKPGAVGPVQRSRVWFVSSLSPQPSTAELKKALEEVPPPEVTDGSVVFAMCYALNGAKPRDTKTEEGKPPLPEEWRQFLPKSAEPVPLSDTLLKNVWP